MTMSLRDQLLQAGLANERQSKEAERQLRQQHSGSGSGYRRTSVPRPPADNSLRSRPRPPKPRAIKS